jgi:hypothetical protein
MSNNRVPNQYLSLLLTSISSHWSPPYSTVPVVTSFKRSRVGTKPYLKSKFIVIGLGIGSRRAKS